MGESWAGPQSVLWVVSLSHIRLWCLQLQLVPLSLRSEPGKCLFHLNCKLFWLETFQICSPFIHAVLMFLGGVPLTSYPY